MKSWNLVLFLGAHIKAPGELAPIGSGTTGEGKPFYSPDMALFAAAAETPRYNAGRGSPRRCSVIVVNMVHPTPKRRVNASHQLA